MRGLTWCKESRTWTAIAIHKGNVHVVGVFKTESGATSALLRFRKRKAAKKSVRTQSGKQKLIIARIKLPTETTIESIRNRLNYDPDTGVLTWRCDRSRFQRIKTPGRNCLNHGKVAGSIHNAGSRDLFYIMIRFNGKNQLAHRLAWAHYYGRWPEGQIDHINGQGTDNRICNLREVTCSQNHRNQKLPVNNTSGFIGVRFNKRTNRWRAELGENRSRTFKSKEDAVACRKSYEQENGYHPNHGRKN